MSFNSAHPPRSFAPPSWATNKNAATSALLSQIVLATALVLPFMSIVKFGSEETYSVLGGVRQMLQEGDVFLAAIIFVFSVVFPLAKNCLLLVATSALVDMPAATRQTLHRLAVLTAKYSMLDVFVAAVLVVVLRFGSVTDVRIGSGTLLFCLAIALSMFASSCVRLKESP